MAYLNHWNYDWNECQVVSASPRFLRGGYCVLGAWSVMFIYTGLRLWTARVQFPYAVITHPLTAESAFAQALFAV